MPFPARKGGKGGGGSTGEPAPPASACGLCSKEVDVEGEQYIQGEQRAGALRCGDELLVMLAPCPGHISMMRCGMAIDFTATATSECLTPAPLPARRHLLQVRQPALPL